MDPLARPCVTAAAVAARSMPMPAGRRGPGLLALAGLLLVGACTTVAPPRVPDEPVRPPEPVLTPAPPPAPQARPKPPVDAADDGRPVAAVTPRLEPLHRSANRPYRLKGRQYRPMTALEPFSQRGVASWYGLPFHGRKTATGDRFDMNQLSAAHPTLPLPSYVRIRNTANGRVVIVRVNDRGPFADDRVIDLSRAAARHLGMIDSGVATVEIDLVLPEGANGGPLASSER